MNPCVCGMNVYECVCESVSEWNECDMNVHECVYESVRICVYECVCAWYVYVCYMSSNGDLSITEHPRRRVRKLTVAPCSTDALVWQ